MAKAATDGTVRVAGRRGPRQPSDFLSEEQRESLADAFASHNVSGDGLLSRYELAE